MLKKILLTLGVTLIVLITVAALRIDVQPNHDTPWSPDGLETRASAEGARLLHRTLLIGDAGSSTLAPLEASLAHAAELAKQAPDDTTVVMLGDNIYLQGFPVLEEGQEAFDEGQLEDISHLDAQLEVARRSSANQVFVPGNHDWYAIELQGQADYIAERAETLGIDAQLLPTPDATDGLAHLPVVAHYPGISHVYLDSQWMIVNTAQERRSAAAQLDTLIQQTLKQHPGNTILLTAHHPLETMGPHAHYYTDRIYPLVIGLLDFLFDDVYQQDIVHEDYKAYIASVETVLQRYPEAKTIFAAGHDHSLQVFGNTPGMQPQYRLVSGSGSLDKVSGTGHNEHTLFAVAQQGFMAIDVTDRGVLLRAFTSTNREEVFSHWLFQH